MIERQHTGMNARSSTASNDDIHSSQAHSSKAPERQEHQRRRERSREPAAEAANSCLSLTGNRTKVIQRWSQNHGQNDREKKKKLN